MKTLATSITALLLCTATAAQGQIFTECADVNQDGKITVSDMVYHLNMFQGGPDLPAGRGDIDFRAGYTLGDFRYLLGYIFTGYPEGGCPPFDMYVLSTTTDTLFLPMATVTPGSGTLQLPIGFVNHVGVTDLLVPVEIVGLGDSLVFDSLKLVNPGSPATIASDWSHAADAGLQISYMAGSLAPGTHILGNMFFHYSNYPGGAISVIPGSPNVNTFVSYVYGNEPSHKYSDLDIGRPTIVFTDEFTLPSLVLEPDTLHFTTVVGGPDPAPQSFDIISTGAPFSWSLTKPSWITVGKTSGTSGESVQVTPKNASLLPGTHYATVTVSTDGALGAPAMLTVRVDVGFPFPAMDANCDGAYNMLDIIYQVNYMFRAGPAPCNPCDGTSDGL